MNTNRILLIDDDADFTESNRDLLEAYGYEVFSASNGTDGLRKIRAIKPDLIILDVMMTTNTEGFDVARQTRELPETREIPILLVTGMTKAMGLSGSLKPDKKWLPVNHILEKPIDPSVLINEVERILKRKGK